VSAGPAQWGAWDLQSHSTYSDGSHAPGEVVRLARAAGVEILALTDHDSIDGVGEAIDEGQQVGLPIIPATELSAVDGSYEEVHILGYFIDYSDAALRETLVDLRRDRRRRVLAMGERMAELDFHVELEGLHEREAAGLPLGRPHLAAAIFDDHANRRRLEAEGVARPADLFPRYLVPGTAAYVPRSRPTVAEAIQLLHDAGGLVFWAHPFWDIDDPAAVEGCLDSYASAGLDGVEVFYPTHDNGQTAWLHEQAQRLDLSASASSDFHGQGHDTFSQFLTFATFGLPVDARWLLRGAEAHAG
jgi:predicted metal-dependent phosphoesterase TrpH